MGSTVSRDVRAGALFMDEELGRKRAVTTEKATTEDRSLTREVADSLRQTFSLFDGDDTMASEVYSKLFAYFSLAVAIVVSIYASVETGNYVPVVFTAFFSLFGFTVSEFLDSDKKEQRRHKVAWKMA
jgi:hypothetical protein